MPIVVWEEERPDPVAAGEPPEPAGPELYGGALGGSMVDLCAPQTLSMRVEFAQPLQVEVEEAVLSGPPETMREVEESLAAPAAATPDFWETPLGAPLPPEPGPDVLRERRKASGLSQAALAARLGVTQGCISNAERGERISRGLRERWMAETR